MAIWLSRHAQTENKPTAREWTYGVLLMFAVMAPWGIPALEESNWEFLTIGFRKHVIDRSFDSKEGHGGHGASGYFLMLPLYFVTIWYSFFPWSIWLPRAVRDFCVRKRFRDPLDGYLAMGVLLVFGIFTLISTKLPHYTLPAFPFLALLLARWWEQGTSPWGSFRTTAISMAIGLAVLTLVVIPLSVRFFVAGKLFAQAEPFLSPGMEMGTLDYEEASLVWTFRRRIDGFQTSLKPAKLTRWMNRPGPRLCIGLKDSIDGSLEKKPEWRTFEAAGWQLAKGKPVQLEVVIKEK
jgi:4-amino-4-deoxy-L-arabinose transferase-like glycosyltransferase